MRTAEEKVLDDLIWAAEIMDHQDTVREWKRFGFSYPYPPPARQDPEVVAWNAAVDAKKAERAARRAAKGKR